jgi:hypothetical protein
MAWDESLARTGDGLQLAEGIGHPYRWECTDGWMEGSMAVDWTGESPSTRLEENGMALCH